MTLRKITFEGVCPLIDKGCFSLIAEDAVAYVPDDELEAYTEAFERAGIEVPVRPAAKTPWSWKTTASRRRISNLIRDRHHHQLQRLRHLPRHPQTIGGAAVKAIGPKAFAQHTYIALAELPEGLETIGDNAFYNCETLARVVFPSTLKSIGDYAFYNAYGSNVLELPSVEHIGAYAFYAIGVTDALELPEGLKTIGRQRV